MTRRKPTRDDRLDAMALTVAAADEDPLAAAIIVDNGNPPMIAVAAACLARDLIGELARATGRSPWELLDELQRAQVNRLTAR